MNPPDQNVAPAPEQQQMEPQQGGLLQMLPQLLQQRQVDPAEAEAAKAQAQKSGNAYRAAAPAPIDATAPFNEAKDAIHSRMLAAVDEQKAREEKQLADLNPKLDQLEVDRNEAVNQWTAYRGKVQNQIDQMDTMSKAIAAQGPRDMWADQSTGWKIAAAAAMSLGAGIQSLYGDKTNVVADQINDAVKRDLTMQQLRMEHMKDSYANRSLLLNQMMKHSDSILEGSRNAYITAIDGIKGRLEANKAIVKSPDMIQAMNSVIAGLDIHQAQAKLEAQQHMVGNDYRYKQGVAQFDQQIAEHTAAKDNSLATVRAITAARNSDVKAESLGHREHQDTLARGTVGYTGEFVGTPQEAAKFREKDAAVQNAARALDNVSKLVTSGIKNWTSFSKNAELQQAYNLAVAQIKGPALLNTGANFTELENNLIRSGYLAPDKITILDPKGAERMIKRAKIEMMKNLLTQAHEHGVKATKHALLGDE